MGEREVRGRGWIWSLGGGGGGCVGGGCGSIVVGFLWGFYRGVGRGNGRVLGMVEEVCGAGKKTGGREQLVSSGWTGSVTNWWFCAAKTDGVCTGSMM